MSNLENTNVGDGHTTQTIIISASGTATTAAAAEANARVLTNRQCFEIIGAVKKRQCLWNIACTTYKNRGLIQIAWEHVADEVNIPKKDVMQKWVLLRQQFRNAFAKHKSTKSGHNKAAPKRACKNIFYKAMLFMAPVFRLSSQHRSSNVKKEPKKVKQTISAELKDDELIDYLEDNLILARNQFPLNKQGRELQQKGWDELAAKLNARNGCTISAEYWRKSWDDLRERVRSKVASNVMSPDDPLDEHVKRVIAMITEEELPIGEIKTESSIEFVSLDPATSAAHFEDENYACLPPPPPPTYIEKIIGGQEDAKMSAFESQYIDLMKEQIQIQRRRDEREEERHILWMKLRNAELQNLDGSSAKKTKTNPKVFEY